MTYYNFYTNTVLAQLFVLALRPIICKKSTKIHPLAWWHTDQSLTVQQYPLMNLYITISHSISLWCSSLCHSTLGCKTLCLLHEIVFISRTSCGNILIVYNHSWFLQNLKDFEYNHMCLYPIEKLCTLWSGMIVQDGAVIAVQTRDQTHQGLGPLVRECPPESAYWLGDIEE